MMNRKKIQRRKTECCLLLLRPLWKGGSYEGSLVSPCGMSQARDKNTLLRTVLYPRTHALTMPEFLEKDIL